MSLEAAYLRIAENFEQHAGGAPKAGQEFSRAFIDYLKLLYAPGQAELVQYLKVTREFYASGFDMNDYTPAGKIAELSGQSTTEVRRLLDPLVQRSALLGNSSMMGSSPVESAKKSFQALRVIQRNAGISAALRVIGQTMSLNLLEVLKRGPQKAGGLFSVPVYALPIFPSLLNVHQFYPQVEKDDLRAGNLYQEFFIKDKYYRRYETSEKGTPTFRTIPVRRALATGQKILSTEEAHGIIDSSLVAALVPCPCRTRTEKLGIRECKDKNPVGACIMLGLSALHFESAGMGKPVSREQAKKYLDEMQDLGLVAATENFSRPEHSIICLCCGCCCSMLRGRTRWDNPKAMLSSNFVPANNEGCLFCGKCEKRCLFGAITVERKLKKHSVDPAKCIGCGVCTIACKQKSLGLRRVERASPPLNAREMYDRIDRENRGGV